MMILERRLSLTIGMNQMEARSSRGGWEVPAGGASKVRRMLGRWGEELSTEKVEKRASSSGGVTGGEAALKRWEMEGRDSCEGAGSEHAAGRREGGEMGWEETKRRAEASCLRDRGWGKIMAAIWRGKRKRAPGMTRWRVKEEGEKAARKVPERKREGEASGEA